MGSRTVTQGHRLSARRNKSRRVEGTRVIDEDRDGRQLVPDSCRWLSFRCTDRARDDAQPPRRPRSVPCPARDARPTSDEFPSRVAGCPLRARRILGAQRDR
jgi:hypothetical protein